MYSPPTPGTVGAELDAARAALEGAGVPHAQIMALSTWATLARTDPGAAWLGRGAPAPAGDLVPRFRDAIARQAAGEPFQYAVGLVGFRRLDLVVDRRTFIPRSLTDGLVDEVLAFARERGGVEWGVAAELGTGSGAVALSLAAEGRFSRVIATDISADALDVARVNYARAAPRTPVEFRHGSWLDPLAGERVGVIVSNPPCVASEDWVHVLPRARDHEPRLAFDGGPDGLGPARTLLDGAHRHLLPGGLLALEIDPASGEVVRGMAAARGWRVRLQDDPGGLGLYLLATRD